MYSYGQHHARKLGTSSSEPTWTEIIVMLQFLDVEITGKKSSAELMVKLSDTEGGSAITHYPRHKTGEYPSGIRCEEPTEMDSRNTQPLQPDPDPKTEGK